MPWKDHSVKQERFQFINDWQSGDWSMSELCRDYQITRATGYKWVERYETGGKDALSDLSRAPHDHPNAIGEEVEDQVIAIRGQHPTWGAPKIRTLLEQKQIRPLPAESTIGAILQRHGLTVPQRKRRSSRKSPIPLAEPGAPNDVWCVDYKGWFRTGDGARIDPLTITDAYSRYLFRCQSINAADYLHSKPVLEAAFREFGLPNRLRSDNGAPFGSNGESGLTKLSVWWIRLGIMPERIEPGKPQQNGRHERMHRTLKQETASPPASTRRAQQQRFDCFRREYNEQRPHEALGQKTPASYYRNSTRLYPARLSEPEYSDQWIVRSVAPGGQMRWKGEYVFVSHALDGQRVGLEPVGEQLWKVWFSFYPIGIFDAQRFTIRRSSPTRPEPQP